MGEIYCHANFFYYANFSIVFRPDFRGAKVSERANFLRGVPPVEESQESTLIVPYWTSAPWWPLLVILEGCFQREIADYMIIVPRENLFIPVVPGLSMFTGNIPNFYLLSLRICFLHEMHKFFWPSYYLEFFLYMFCQRLVIL